MSDAMAIAAVTAVLKRLVQDSTVALPSDLGTVDVTAVPPDKVIDTGNGKPGLNLFMYRVSQNPGWANADLPARDARGRRVSNPPIALDLHYMLTAVGAKDYHCDILLGHGMQALHEFPILPRDLITQKLHGSDSLISKLAASGLAEQVEQIKLSPHFPDADGISKIWSSLQAKFRPSAFYTASVVLIRSHRPVHRPLPVRRVSSHVLQIRRPHIEAVVPAPSAGDGIEAGDTVEIRGQRLSADHVAVRIGSTTTPVAAGDVSDTSVDFDLPDDLYPGPHIVQVVHLLEMTDPDTGAPAGGLRPIFESNPVPLSVRPSVVGVSYANNTVTVDLGAPVGRGQRIFLTLQPRDPSQAEPMSFAMAPPSAPKAELKVTVSGLQPSTNYVVRLQVDGVENLIGFDDATGELAGPSFNTGHGH